MHHMECELEKEVYFAEMYAQIYRILLVVNFIHWELCEGVRSVCVVHSCTFRMLPTTTSNDQRPSLRLDSITNHNTPPVIVNVLEVPRIHDAMK